MYACSMRLIRGGGGGGGGGGGTTVFVGIPDPAYVNTVSWHWQGLPDIHKADKKSCTGAMFGGTVC